MIDQQLSIYPVKEPELRPVKESEFDDHELTLAELASMAQNGRKSVPVFAPVWIVMIAGSSRA